MKVSLKYNSESTGQNVPQANSIAQSLDYEQEGKYYIIHFEDEDDPNLEKIYNLVSNLKGTTILTKEGEQLSGGTFFNVIKCNSKLLCDGVCKHVRFGHYPLDEFLLQYNSVIEDDILLATRTSLIRELSDFLTQKSETEFEVNQDLIWEYIQEELEVEQRFCDKIDMKAIEQKVQELPEEIHLVDERELYQEEESYRDFFSGIREILNSAPISSQLSFKDTLKCAKAISILLSQHHFGNALQYSGVEDAPIFVGYNLESDMVSFLKVIMSEKGDKLPPESETDFKISKEKGCFKVSQTSMILYFQAFPQNDLELEDFYNTLKQL